jgi:hypothetical protein
MFLASSLNYKVISEVATNLGFKVTTDESIDCDIIWHDVNINSSVFSKMQPY